MTITIGIMCFVLVYIMSIQFRTVRETDLTSIKTMREEELRTELANWKTKYEETNQKLEETEQKIKEYEDKVLNNQEASDLLEKELLQTKLIVGNTDVQGEGVEIIFKDGEQRVVASDLLKLINELKLAGAEAISINEERIINLSDITDVYPYIWINGQRLRSPFVIKAIGNQKYLESGLTAKNGIVDNFISQDKSIVVTGSSNIKIAKYNKELKLNYIK